MTTLKSRAHRSDSVYRTACGRKKRKSQRSTERFHAGWWRKYCNQRERRASYKLWLERNK